MYLFFGLLAAFILVLKGLSLYADYCWFQSLGRSDVFFTMRWTRVGLGVPVGLLIFFWLWLNAKIARRRMPEGVVLVGRRLLTDEERGQVETYLSRVLLVFALMGGFVGGTAASGHWVDWVHFRNAVPFGYKDPLFGLDASFYVFKLNFLIYLWRAVFYGIAVAFIMSVLVYFYEEAIRVVGSAVHVMDYARTHVYGLLALLLLVKAVGYRLDQLRLTLSARGEVFYGASYADVHARLPILWALLALSVLAAIVIAASVRSRRFLVPGGAVAVLVLVSVLGGAMYPAVLQRLVVKPNQLEKERPYIAFNIDATRKAFALDKVKDAQFPVGEPLTWDGVKRNWTTVQSVRVWDHRPLEQTYQQMQALRPYYSFSDVDVDRYTVDGAYRQIMIAARQLDYSQIPGAATWVKSKLQYTHGYGVCMSPVNEIGGEGLPLYWIRDIPPVAKSELKITQPALYYMASIHPRLIEYISPPEESDQPAPAPAGPPSMDQVGEKQPGGTRSEMARGRRTQGIQSEYCIANTGTAELDYPKVREGQGEANATTRYAGLGGVPLNGFFRRLAFTARFLDLNILLTGDITEKSRVIMNRYFPEGLMELTPWIMCDPDPYLVVLGGRVKWVCDAYTISNRFPYSRPIMGIANYIRNSIKIVCDAYDGIPEYYAFDPSDPLLQCYMKVFPGLFKPMSEMAPEMKKHLRYPQLLFLLQAETYGDYHMDPDTFYQREDSWSIPVEMYSNGRRQLEAYYVIMKLPGSDHEEFVVMLPMTLRGKEERNMVAWMAARCDAPNYGQLIAYRFPKDALVYGPMQFEYRVSQDSQISELFTLWGQHGSRIIRGNTLAIPIEHSVLYVEPVYLVSTAGATNSGSVEHGLPELRIVIAAIGDRLAMGSTVEEAIGRLFGVVAGPGPMAAEKQQPRGGEKPAQPAAGPSIPATGLLRQIDQALQLDQQARDLLKQGDLAGYQRKHDEERQLLEQMKSMAK
jgi:hypothetical protein